MNEELDLYVTPKVRCLSCHEQISDDLFLTLCGVEQCLPDYKFSTGNRSGYHLHVILKGKGTLCVNGKEEILRFGQMFITKPGEDTWYKADTEDPWFYCWMTFDGRVAQKCVDDAGFYKGVNYLSCNVDRQIFYKIVSNLLDHAEVSPANIYLCTGFLLEYISAAIDSYYKAKGRTHRSHEYQASDYVAYAREFIQANYATVKVSDVAKYVGLHRSYLTTLFKAKIGISPQEYIMQCKLGKACKYLEETNNPIQEISRQVGYDNPLTFSKTFKSFYGASPKAYRRQYQDRQDGGIDT